MICKKRFFLAGLTLCVWVSGNSQIVTSVRNGYWHEPSTWSTSSIPSTSSTGIVLNHEVFIGARDSVVINCVKVNGRLTVAKDAILHVLPNPRDTSALFVSSKGSLFIEGLFIGRDSAIITGTRITNTSFGAGSVYRHLWGSKGHIPYGYWHPESTLEISGFKGSGYIAIAHSDSWKQNFGNVIYDCPEQTSFVDLNGYLKSIAGDLIIKNTNAQALRLSTTQDPLISIAGSLRIEGPSEVWFSTASDSAVIHIGKDFSYLSTSTGPSYFSTQGIAWVTVGGAMRINTPGALRMNSGTDNPAVRRTTLVLHGGLSFLRGSMIAPSPGKGIIRFGGRAVQDLYCSTSSFNGNFDFFVEEQAFVDVGTSVWTNASGDLHVKGVLSIGSDDPQGAIQLPGGGGNIQIKGVRKFYTGAGIDYSGTSLQKMGNGHPSNAGVDLICNNTSGISLTSNILVRNLLIMKGSVHAGSSHVDLHGDLMIERGATLSAPSSDINLSGNRPQRMQVSGNTIKNIIVEKGVGGDVILLDTLRLAGQLWVKSMNTTIHSNGYLTLLSTSADSAATASVGPLSFSSSIKGAVTVQRHMGAKGKLYRYIASPVADASVASLMDDLPVTGSFNDPSRGKGLTANASLFYYDMEAWKAYPVQGYARENPLEVGKGYSVYLWRSGPALWDVTGTLNQGSILLPIQFAGNGPTGVGEWKLVGNPYASPIAWNQPEGWDKGDSVSAVIAVRDNEKGIFHYWDGKVGTLHDGIIASGQSFWVRVTDRTTLRIHEQAKVIHGAPYYREPKERDSDHLEIRISNGATIDRAYVRIETQATPGMDLFDAPKLANDFMSLSVVTPAREQLAISAISRTECEQYFPLNLMFATDDKGGFIKQPYGTYTLSLHAAGLFSYAKLFVHDRYTRNRVKVTAGSGYSFEVTREPSSYSPERFVIITESVSPEEPFLIEHESSVCGQSNFTLRLNNIQEGVAYIPVVNNEPVLQEYKTTSEDLWIHLPGALLKDGKNQLSIVASTLCGTVYGEVFYVHKEKPPGVTTGYYERCLSGSLTLQVAGEPEDVSYHWYDEKSITLPIADVYGPAFTTPVLEHNTTFYVSAVTKSGCESERKEVVAHIIQYEPATIEYNDGVLWSNYSEGNQWFFDGKILPGATAQSLNCSTFGTYEVKITVGNCVTETSFKFIPTALEHDAGNSRIVIAPVPFVDYLTIQSPENEKLKRIILFSMSGQKLDDIYTSERTYTLEVTKLPQGMYIVMALTEKKEYFLKVMK